MVHIRTAVWLGIFLFGLNLLAQPDASYPARMGAVNDYAGKLSPAQERELTGLIEQYKQQTSIEFVVVVADTLNGRSVRDYAIGLGDSWQVGQGERHNGIVLLWAPKERAYSLRAADGLSPELSDADAKQITQQNLLPNFKSGKYYTGLKETVVATMERLGNRSWEERLQARAAMTRLIEQQSAAQKHAAEIQRQQAEAQQAEENKEAAKSAAIALLAFLLIVGFGVLIPVVIVRSRRRKAKLAEMAEAGDLISGYLRTAEKNAPEAQALLDEFAKEMPEQNIDQLRNSLAGQPDRILKTKIEFQCLNLNDPSAYDAMVRARSNAEGEARLLENAKQEIAQVKAAKAHSQALMADLARGNFQVANVLDTGKVERVNQLLLQSQQDYERARQNSSMSVLDWLLINQLLSNSQTQFQQALQYSQEPPYVPPRRYSRDDDDSRSSSWGSFGGSSSSSSSSGSSWSSSSSSGSSSSSSDSSFSSGSGSDGSY